MSRPKDELEVPHWNSWNKDLESELAKRKTQDLLRAVESKTRVSATEFVIDSKRYLQFASNDYLGLAWSHAADDAELYWHVNRENGSLGTHGSGASPMVSGYAPAHARLEHALAQFKKTEAAILFSTGYAANSGTIACLTSQDDLILSDELNHASIIDGCRLSKATTFVFRHNDLSHVSNYLKNQRINFRQAYLVTDSLFSMNGDLADLVGINELCKQFQIIPIVDEAHATGVYGPSGRGLVDELGLEGQFPILIGTLSKAIGSLGGFVAGSKTLISYLRNFARPYVYSTSMPISNVETTLLNLRRLIESDATRVQLRQRSTHLRSMLREGGWNVSSGDSPIVPITVKSANVALELARRLRELGVYVPAIRPPTVPENASMLRISLCAQHTEAHLAQLVTALNKVRDPD